MDSVVVVEEDTLAVVEVQITMVKVEEEEEGLVIWEAVFRVLAVPPLDQQGLARQLLFLPMQLSQLVGWQVWEVVDTVRMTALHLEPEAMA